MSKSMWENPAFALQRNPYPNACAHLYSLMETNTEAAVTEDTIEQANIH